MKTITSVSRYRSSAGTLFDPNEMAGRRGKNLYRYGHANFQSFREYLPLFS